MGLGALEFIVIGVQLVLIVAVVSVPLTIAWRRGKAQGRREAEHTHGKVERADNV